jgi:hypothetical protein
MKKIKIKINLKTRKVRFDNNISTNILANELLDMYTKRAEYFKKVYNAVVSNEVKIHGTI